MNKMHVHIHLDSANDPSFLTVLNAFGEGMKAEGEDSFEFLRYGEKSQKKSDYNVFWGSWKNRSDLHHRVKQELVYGTPQTPFFMIETPFIGRGPVENVMRDKEYRIGHCGFLGGQNAFKYPPNFHGRFNQIVNRTGSETRGFDDVGPCGKTDGPIVIVLQLPGDASLGGMDISKWALDQVMFIRRRDPLRPIVVRTPQLDRDFWSLDLISKFPNVSIQKGTRENLFETIDEAYFVLTYSSGMSIDCAMRSVPCVAMSPNSLMYNIYGETELYLNGNFTYIQEFYSNDFVQDRLERLSWGQWSLEEIRNGTYWDFIRNVDIRGSL